MTLRKTLAQKLLPSLVACSTIGAAHSTQISKVEPETQNFLNAVNKQTGPQIYELSIKDARAVLDNAQSGVSVTKLTADVEDRVIPVGPSGKVSIRIVRPQGNKEILPAVVYFHGGGWVLGNKETHDRLIREIANGANAAVIFVNFSPSPEVKFPVPVEEAYAATKWVSENGKSLNIDASRIAVAGDSVGGNMAAAVTLLAKERNAPAIRYQVLFYPVTDANFDNSSYHSFAKGYFLTREAMKWFWNQYAPQAKDRKKIIASPLQATTEQLKGLPAALIITAENDVLRDEGEAYGHKLAQAGVKVVQTRYLGTIHDFVMLNVITNTPAPRAAIQQANEALKKAFE